MSFKRWLNIATVVLIVLVVFFARHDLYKAWLLLSQINIWIFLLIIPIQFISYFASGEIMFSYLRSRGDLKDVDILEAPKMALELNFVNHIFPTAGVSGASYMTYRLSKVGVSTGRATLSQVVKFAVMFLSYTALLIIAVLLVTIDGNLTRMTILVASTLVSIIIAGIAGAMFVLGSKRRLEKFESFLDKLINHKIRKFFRRSKPFVKRQQMSNFFADLHDDYLILRRDPKCLRTPFLWGLVFNIAETAMFMVTFLALGAFVNPAPILIALGLAGLVGAFMVTPGGAGGFEAAMILFLSAAGVDSGTAVAGVLLVRTSLIILTIASGYIFYSLAMKKYGKHAD